MARIMRTLAAAYLALCVGSAAGQAQTEASYPSKPIRMVVPVGPGGATDLTARTIAQKMSETLGQSVIIENKPGANTVTGAGSVAMSPPDGYTLLMAPRETFGINPSLYAKLPYDPLKSFSYIGIATEGPYVLVTNPSLGTKTIGGLLTLARSKTLAYGSFGIGSLAQLNLEAFSQRHDIRLKHVPYKGAADAVKAVVQGKVDLSISTPPSALAFIQDNLLTGLVSGSEKRLPMLPQVPTLTESGLASDTLLPVYFGLAAPAGTPRNIVERLNAELRRALAVPAVSKWLADRGLVATGSTPEDMATTVAQDVARFAALVKSIGIEPAQ